MKFAWSIHVADVLLQSMILISLHSNSLQCRVKLSVLSEKLSKLIYRYLGPRCEPTKVTRAYNEDGQASDRWIAEFNTFDLAEKAYRVRGKINERPIRARRYA